MMGPMEATIYLHFGEREDLLDFLRPMLTESKNLDDQKSQKS